MTIQANGALSLVLFLLLSFFTENLTAKNLSASQTVKYSISFSRPETHYCEVEMNFAAESDKVIIALPVWTPGSYMVREFSRNVDHFKAFSGNTQLDFYKVSKNEWEIITNGHKDITVSFHSYCNEFTVRTSEINDAHAFINCSNVFPFIKGHTDNSAEVKIDLPSGWSKISTGLKKISENLYSADNYDILADSPFEAGNQNVLDFNVSGKDHHICLYGFGNYDPDSLRNDFKRIVKEEENMFGTLPYENYTFICHLVENGGGGLEHLNSFAIQFPGIKFKDKKSYKSLLGLIAHEFFHCWNVKRIRPYELGPFDYEKENYTKLLWVAEGFTSFYDNLILYRAGFLNKDEYLDALSKEINDAMRYEGRKVMSLEDASYDAWIKYYRKDENSNNSQISYYTKGSVVANMLNIGIITSSEGKNCLDDVLRELYEDYKKDPSHGYTNERLKSICEQLAGTSLDVFWNKYISGTDELPLNQYLNKAGLKLENINAENKTPVLNADLQETNGRVIIRKVYAGGTAYESGLETDDEIIAINKRRVNLTNLPLILSDSKIDDELSVLITRQGGVVEKKIKLLPALPEFKVKAIESPNEEMKKVFSKWFNG
ncbi:PDZ domain-containing protein [soil metagenome]